MLEQRYHLQEFPTLSIFVSCYTARISNRQIRAVRQVYELLELFTPSDLADAGSTGDAEEYKREYETYTCWCSFCTVGHVVLVANSHKYGSSNSFKNTFV